MKGFIDGSEDAEIGFCFRPYVGHVCARSRGRPFDEHPSWGWRCRDADEGSRQQGSP